MTPVPCPACQVLLVRHCHICTWKRCPNKSCDWRLYDFDTGVRVDESGNVERLAAP